MRILFLVKNFRQGWGGAPESVRLMARQLAATGISSDVFDGGKVHRTVELMDALPRIGAVAEKFPSGAIADYGAILQVGPWQHPLELRRIFSRRTAKQKTFYLPRGGLARADFSGWRGVKKVPYFPLIERSFLDGADGIVFSSAAEQRTAIRGARHRGPEHIIPDFFEPPPLSEDAGVEETVTFAFLAEIAPIKGLQPLVRAFADWASDRQHGRKVRLVIGGAPRPGREGYLEATKALLDPYAGSVDVRFTGPVSHGDRAAFYGRADVLTVSSVSESYGLTVLEGLSAGCGLLAAPNVGVLEYLPEHPCRTVLPSLDHRDLVAGLDSAFEAAQRYRSARHEIREYAQDAIAAINRTAHRKWADLLS